MKEEWRGADKRLKDSRDLEKRKSTLLDRREITAQVHEFPSPSLLGSLPVSPFFILMAHKVSLSFNWYSFNLRLPRILDS